MFNKQNLIDLVHENLRGTKSQSEELVEEIISAIKKQVRAGNVVKIAGLGMFFSKKTNPRTARNPKTNEKVQVPAGKKIKFVPAKGFKDLINS